MKRRALAILLALCMVMSLLPITAWASDLDLTVKDDVLMSALTESKLKNLYYNTISASAGHCMAIKEDGSLWSWGFNAHGELGDGTTNDLYLPKKILEDVVSVSAGANIGENHSLAIKSDGTLWAWGYNKYGQVGDGTTVTRTAPVKIMDDVASICAGDTHSLAVKTDGSLWGWGDNHKGLLGDGTTADRVSPVKIMDNVATISTGGYNTLIVKTDGTLWVCGDNFFGSVGDGTTTNRLSPVKIMEDVVSVAGGRSLSAAIKSDGSLWTWGNNRSGEIGIGTVSERCASPTKIMDNVIAVEAGGANAFAVKSDGSLWAWGYNGYGSLGDGTTNDSSVPIKIMDDAVAVSNGRNTMILKKDGSLWAFGANHYGNIGDGTMVDRYTPVKVLDGIRLPRDLGGQEPDIPIVSGQGNVLFLGDWNAATRTVKFGDSGLISPDIYIVIDSVDASNIDSLLNKYVLVTMEQGDSSLEHTITDIQSVESRIGTVSATGEHSLTIDGTTYPVREDYKLASYDGEDVLYHVSNGTIMGFDVLEEKHGVLGSWNDATKKITIGGAEYPTNYLTDLSFMDNIRDYFQKDVYFLIADSSGYCPMIKITGLYSPGGNVNKFNADIYHANWLSQDITSATKLNEKTPSDILSEQLTNRGMETATVMWKSLQVIFDTIEDPTSIKDFAFEKKDMYSAIVLDALESSVSYDVIDSFFEDYYDQLGNLFETVSKAIQLQHNIDITKPGEFVRMTRQQRADVQEETKKWFEKEFPELTVANSIFDGISMGFDSIESLENYGERIASTLLLANTNESMKAVIRQAYQNSRSTNNIDLQLALNECVQIMDASTEELCQRLVAGEVTVLGGKALKYLIKEQLWGEVTKTLNQVAPEVAILKNVYKVESFLCDKLTNASSAIEQYLKILSTLDVENLINGVYNDLRQAFLSEKESQQALVYLEAMRLMFKLRDADCESAVDYIDVIYTEDIDIFDDSLLLIIKRLFGAKDNDDIQALKKSIQNIQSYYNDVYIDTEKGWIFGLEDDFPGTGLYEKYLKFYESGGEASLVKEYKAACPVNVYVYDQQDNIVASVVDDRVSCSVDDVMIALVGDEKTIRLYNGADYRIEYLGYDTGDMDITITEFDEGEKTTRMVNYYDLALTDGKTYVLDANDETLKPYDLIDKSDNSTVQHDYDSMDNTSAHTIKIISGTLQQGGELFAETTASKGETLQLNAYVPQGYEFVRWEVSGANALIADPVSINTTLIMPDEDLVVTAIMRGTSSPSTTHTVTFNPNGGTVDVSSAVTTSNGKLSTLPIPILIGHTFDGWFTSANGGEKITTDYVFTSNTTVYAHWTKNGGNSSGGSSSGGSSSGGGSSSTSYTIMAGNFAHGSVSVSPKSATKGTKVTLTIWADQGYTLDSLVVKDAKGNSVNLVKETDAKYTFTMPNSKVTIAATFSEIEQHPLGKINFTDVSVDAYYYDAVAWAVEKGITVGTSATTFSPDAPCTRAQIVTFLWRAAGSPSMGGSNPFTDVAPGSYYYDAVQWAVAQGITVGTSATTFSPDATCTRGQTVTFLYRYEKSPAVSGGNAFTDVPSDAYYTNAVQWAVNNGVTAGTSATTFSPNAICTRGQIVTFLYRDMA